MAVMYVLRSLVNGKRYVGSTSRGLQERLREHNSGGVRSTNGSKPWEVFYSESFETLDLAQRREKYFKTGKGRNVLKSILSEIDRK